MAKKKAASRIARPGGKRARELTPQDKRFISGVGARIAAARLRLGVTAKELAEMVNVSIPTQSRREQGRQSMPLEDLSRYSAALKCKPAELLP